MAFKTEWKPAETAPTKGNIIGWDGNEMAVLAWDSVHGLWRIKAAVEVEYKLLLWTEAPIEPGDVE